MVMVQGGFNYKKIPELNELMATVQKGHNRLLADKRGEVRDILVQCVSAIHRAANENEKVKGIVANADHYYDQKRQQVNELKSLALLDGLVPPMLQYKDTTVDRIETILAPPAQPKQPPVSVVSEGGSAYQPSPATPQPPKKIIKNYNRQIIFPAKRLESEADIETYVEKIRDQLKQLLKNCDGIQLK